MQAPLARRLAARGNRVVTMDPLGHGASSRPRDQWRYSISAFAQLEIAGFHDVSSTVLTRYLETAP